MTDSCTIQANGIELCYETFGDPGAEPLLLIMGLGAQMTNWPVELCEGLADRGFHVIRYDNRDTGLSSKVEHRADDFITTYLAAIQGQPVEVAYTLRDLAADGMALLDHLGITSAHVVGASMGGMVAQTMAIEHPARVRTLTSIMSTTGELGLASPTAAVLQVILRPSARTRDAAIEHMVDIRRVIGSPGHFDESVARRLSTESYDRSWTPSGTIRQLLAIAASGSRAEALARLRVPTLVIHGDLDPLVPIEGGRRTAELIPGARLVVLEGMGHDLPLMYLGPIIDAVTSLAARAPAT